MDKKHAGEDVQASGAPEPDNSSGTAVIDSAHADSVAKIWTVVGLGSLYLNLNVFIVTQGGHMKLPGPVPEGVRQAAEVYGTWVAGSVFLALLLISIYWIRQPWAESRNPKLPTAFSLNLKPGDKLTVWYHRFFLLSYLLVPLYAQGHFLRKTLDGRVVDGQTGAEVAKGWWSHLSTFSDPRLIFTDGNRFQYDEELTFFPFWQPWLTLIAFILMLWLTARILYHLRS